MVNYLTLLGWSPRDGREFIDVAACVDQFRLEDVSHSPAFFDVKKLTHMNGDYIRNLDLDAFIARALPWVTPWASSWQPSLAPPWNAQQFDDTKWRLIAPLVQTRVTRLDEIGDMVDFLFLPDAPMNEDAFRKAIGDDSDARTLLRDVAEVFVNAPWAPESLMAAVTEVGERHGRNLRKTQAPVRCAVTGKTVGPPLFESLALVGREETVRRLHAAAERVVP
jgi:glutamyl-tRNA synthetase